MSFVSEKVIVPYEHIIKSNNLVLTGYEPNEQVLFYDAWKVEVFVFLGS